jgi:hypothetical protein
VRGGDFSCEAQTGRGIPLVGNWSEMPPTGWKCDVLLVWVLTKVPSLPRLESWPYIVNLGLHVVDGVGLPSVKGDLFAIKGGPNPGPH